MTSAILLYILLLNFLLYCKGFFPTAQPCLLTPHTVGNLKSWDPACWDLTLAPRGQVSVFREIHRPLLCLFWEFYLSFISYSSTFKNAFVWSFAKVVSKNKHAETMWVCTVSPITLSSPPQGTSLPCVFPATRTPNLEPFNFQLPTLWSHISAQPFYSLPSAQYSITPRGVQYPITVTD